MNHPVSSIIDNQANHDSPSEAYFSRGKLAANELDYLTRLTVVGKAALEYLISLNQASRDISELPFTERHEKLIEHSSDLAAECGLSEMQNRFLCYQMAAGVFLSIGSYADFAHGFKHSLPNARFEDLMYYGFCGHESTTSTQNLVSALIAQNPIVGAITAVTWADLNYSDSFIEHVLRGRTPPVSVKGWYLTIMQDLAATNEALSEIFLSLNDRAPSSSPHYAKTESFLKRWYDEWISLLTDVANAACTFALTRANNGLSESSSVLYWPMFPCHESEKGTLIHKVQSLYTQGFREFHRDYLKEVEETKRVLAIPSPLSIGDLMWFVSYLKDYSVNLANAIQTGAIASTQDSPVLKLGNAFRIVARPRADSHGQARIGIKAVDSRFSDFKVRVDNEGQRIAFDLGSVDIFTAIDYANLYVKGIDQYGKIPYSKLIDDEGNLKKRQLRQLSFVRGAFSDGTRASIIAAILMSNGTVLLNRDIERQISHHSVKHVDGINPNDFEEIVKSIRTALKRQPRKR